MWCLFTPVKLFSCFLSFLQLNCYECLTWSALAVLSARPSFPLLRIIFGRLMINLTSAKLPVMENISYKVKPASFSSCCKEQPSKKFFGVAWLIIFSFCRVLGIWDSQEFLFKSNACFTRALPVSFRFSLFFFLAVILITCRWRLRMRLLLQPTRVLKMHLLSRIQSRFDIFDFNPLILAPNRVTSSRSLFVVPFGNVTDMASWRVMRKSHCTKFT